MDHRAGWSPSEALALLTAIDAHNSRSQERVAGLILAPGLVCVGSNNHGWRSTPI